MKAVVAVTYLVHVDASKHGLTAAIREFKAGHTEGNGVDYDAERCALPERVEIRMQTCDERRKCSECGKSARGLRKLKDAANQTHYMHAKCWRELRAWLRGQRQKYQPPKRRRS